MFHAMDRLVQAIQRTGNPTVAGLDTRLEYLPPSFAQSHMQANTLEEAAKAILAYNKKLVDALHDIIPAVKVQLAYYEMYGVAGLQAFQDTCRYAAQHGLLVMADGKRNDIDATAEAYAAAFLGDTPVNTRRVPAFDVDFLTVNPYLGIDGVQPFMDACGRYGKGIFLLVKTSNPSSGDFQDVDCGGIPLYERVGMKCAEWGSGLVGAEGFSAVGAVVGATYPEQGARLRQLLPNTFFLVPGYGAQGATAQDLAGTFDTQGRGAVVNASRSLLCAWQKRSTDDFAQAARDEALRMRDELRACISGL